MDVDEQDSRITITTGCFGNLIEHIGKDGTYQKVKLSPGWAELVLALGEYMKSKRDLLISSPMAEQMLFNIGAVLPVEQERMVSVTGRNLTTGLPERIEVSRGRPVANKKTGSTIARGDRASGGCGVKTQSL